jgi:acarbose 7IV-phosphotransferase
MARIFVAGLINIETTLKVDAFPVTYQPVRYPFFGVNTTVSGVGYNISKALSTLDHEGNLASLIGGDYAAQQIRHQLHALGVSDRSVLSTLDHTPQSVILYDGEGKRAIFTDLKDIQDRSYPQADFAEGLQGCALAVLANINFSRYMLAQVRAAGIPIATDVHAISSIDDAYNHDYMAAADILFQSHEHLPCPPEDWIRLLWQHFNNRIIVIGLGSDGALLGLREDAQILHIPAAYTRPVVNTIGAGDALFSSFLHGFVQSGNAVEALRKAVVFASYKIGEAGAADGFLTAPALEDWYRRVYG